MQPSLLSFVISALAAGITLSAASWPYQQNKPLFMTYLSGDYGITSIFKDINIVMGQTLNSPLAYNIAVLIFAGLVGITVFTVMESIRHMLRDAISAIEEVEYADANSKRAVEHAIEVRIGLRVLTAFIWIGYSVIFFNILIPALVAYVVGTPASGGMLDGVFRNIVAFTIIFLGFHIHVICMRLLVLRPRLFAGDTSFIGRGGH